MLLYNMLNIFGRDKVHDSAMCLQCIGDLMGVQTEKKTCWKDQGYLIFHLFKGWKQLQSENANIECMIM